MTQLLFVLANLESYNAILIKQGKTQEERMPLLRELVMQQLQTLETLNVSNMAVIGENKNRE